ncbi:hypothetical protein Q664_11830 [Archangium violaceum Cb vi76]|uniref:Uncharacterized protein n=1 Tax=Archangium violaceum Cb vi76 TaxID=1406225 RepID=A0A084SWY8_9BACT|nr:hypothetical protein Q664_11830 [Archangium violaceum Cb vi76]
MEEAEACCVRLVKSSSSFGRTLFSTESSQTDGPAGQNGPALAEITMPSHPFSRTPLSAGMLMD